MLMPCIAYAPTNTHYDQSMQMHMAQFFRLQMPPPRLRNPPYLWTSRLVWLPCLLCALQEAAGVPIKTRAAARPVFRGCASALRYADYACALAVALAMALGSWDRRMHCAAMRRRGRSTTGGNSPPPPRFMPKGRGSIRQTQINMNPHPKQNQWAKFLTGDVG